MLPDGGDPVRLRHGDVAIRRCPDRFTVADAPATVPQVVIHPGQRCTTPDGQDVYQPMDLGARTWGNDPHGSTTKLTGTYLLQSEVSARLLDGLPPLH